MSQMIEVDSRDVRELENLFRNVEKYTNKNVDKMINKTMRFALQSAAKATKPIVRGKKLAKKYLFRPLVPIPESEGYWYARKDSQRARAFQLDKLLTRRDLLKRNLRRVKKAIKVQNQKGVSYIPYAGTKRNLNDRRFRIPNAGLARDGWYRSLRNFGAKPTQTPLQRRNRKVRGIHKARISFLVAEAINRVSYVSKSSPGSARTGLRKAKNRVLKKEQEKLDKAIERKFNKR